MAKIIYIFDISLSKGS